VIWLVDLQSTDVSDRLLLLLLLIVTVAYTLSTVTIRGLSSCWNLT